VEIFTNLKLKNKYKKKSENEKPFLIRINHVEIVNFIMKICNIDKNINISKFLNIISKFIKLKYNFKELQNLFITNGIILSQDQLTLIKLFFSINGELSVHLIKEINQKLGKYALKIKDQMNDILKLIEYLEYWKVFSNENIRFELDFSFTNKFHRYDGIMINFGLSNHNFISFGFGGRYSNLIKLFNQNSNMNCLGVLINFSEINKYCQLIDKLNKNMIIKALIGSDYFNTLKERIEISNMLLENNISNDIILEDKNTSFEILNTYCKEFNIDYFLQTIDNNKNFLNILKLQNKNIKNNKIKKKEIINFLKDIKNDTREEPLENKEINFKNLDENDIKIISFDNLKLNTKNMFLENVKKKYTEIINTFKNNLKIIIAVNLDYLHLKDVVTNTNKFLNTKDLSPKVKDSMINLSKTIKKLKLLNPKDTFLLYSGVDDRILIENFEIH
jgi:hypothetical protein